MKPLKRLRNHQKDCETTPQIANLRKSLWTTYKNGKPYTRSHLGRSLAGTVLFVVLARPVSKKHVYCRLEICSWYAFRFRSAFCKSRCNECKSIAQGVRFGCPGLRISRRRRRRVGREDKIKKNGGQKISLKRSRKVSAKEITWGDSGAPGYLRQWLLSSFEGTLQEL